MLNVSQLSIILHTLYSTCSLYIARPEILMSPSCLESQGCRFDSTFLYIYIIYYMLLFFCLLCSRCFCLILFCILLSSFSLHLHFPKVRLFCVAFVFDCFLERLGYEYFSWWYMQHMLPYGAGIISLYAFI